MQPKNRRGLLLRQPDAFLLQRASGRYFPAGIPSFLALKWRASRFRNGVLCVMYGGFVPIAGRRKIPAAIQPPKFQPHPLATERPLSLLICCLMTHFGRRRRRQMTTTRQRRRRGRPYTMQAENADGNDICNFKQLWYLLTFLTFDWKNILQHHSSFCHFYTHTVTSMRAV